MSLSAARFSKEHPPTRSLWNVRTLAPNLVCSGRSNPARKSLTLADAERNQVPDQVHLPCHADVTLRQTPCQIRPSTPSPTTVASTRSAAELKRNLTENVTKAPSSTNVSATPPLGFLRPLRPGRRVQLEVPLPGPRAKATGTCVSPRSRRGPEARRQLLHRLRTRWHPHAVLLQCYYSGARTEGVDCLEVALRCS